MTTLSTYLSNAYMGIQGVQGISGANGTQGTQGVRGTLGIGSTITNIGLATISGSSYTFGLSDVDRFVSLNSGGGTISSNTFNEGNVITIFNNSSSNQFINFASGVNAYLISSNVGISSVGITSNQYISILCVDNNKFIVY